MEGWESRQEKGNAYLHVSKPNWLDNNMNGIHLETYIMDGQLQMGYAPVCVHCEGGFPKQREFMSLFTEQARAKLKVGRDIKLKVHMVVVYVRLWYQLNQLQRKQLMIWQVSSLNSRH